MPDILGVHDVPWVWQYYCRIICWSPRQCFVRNSHKTPGTSNGKFYFTHKRASYRLGLVACAVVFAGLLACRGSRPLMVPRAQRGDRDCSTALVPPCISWHVQASRGTSFSWAWQRARQASVDVPPQTPCRSRCRHPMSQNKLSVKLRIGLGRNVSWQRVRVQGNEERSRPIWHQSHK